MLKTFSYNDNIKLSKNFTSREFRCKCGKAHDYKIETALIEKLQALTDVLEADKVIINSGYRCPAHDRNVGGNGYGQHTKGTAADIKAYKNGQPIDTRKIACKMQDLGFTGIGNIDRTYTAIHGDVRNTARWFGDEAVPGGTLNNVTSDYYSYYGINKSSHKSAISDLQELLNKKGAALKADGIAGEKTVSECKKYIIDNGDKGELTKWVQERLNALGYSCGIPDGIAGSKTMTAISKWQSDNKLGCGYLGGSDWNVLLDQV